MKKLWNARFNADSNALLDSFNSSLPIDKKLWKQDIKGSIEHAKMLEEIGILNKSELKEIIDSLNEIIEEIKNNTFDFDGEDIHMSIESTLTKKIGQVGKKIHTGRSRNDQVALDFKMYCLEENKNISDLLRELISTFIDISKNHINTIMPGFTHLQHAQPVSLAFHLLSHCASFKRDIERLEDNRKRNNDCPLGSAALAGSVYKNERHDLAKRLGFELPCINAMDGVSSRDFAIDLLYDISMIFMHISRLAEELILWSSYEFKFISFSDSFSTGSSIMPQKKNPDVAELLRGKCGRSFGNLIALLSTMKALPMAYNKDMQEDKDCVFNSVDNVKISLEILNQSLKSLSFFEENMLKACQVGHLVATDLADFLVNEFKMAFRDAYFLTGKCVKELEKINCDLSNCDLNFLIKILDIDFNEEAKSKLKDSLNLFKSMERRDTFGGTATSSVREQIKIFEDFLDNLRP